MRRREFITLLGSAAAAWPLAARAQPSGLPVVAVLSDAAPSESDEREHDAFRRGLDQSGYASGRNVTVEFYLTDAQRIPSIMSVMVARNVAVIVAVGNTAAQSAKAATASIPIVFLIGGNPVNLGLVASLNRPGGNVTGFTNINAELEAKRLELLAELIPEAKTIAVLLNPSGATTPTKVIELEAAAQKLGRRLRILKAESAAEVEMAFATAVEERVGALLIASDAFFNSQTARLGSSAARHAVPAIYNNRDFVAAGGLMSYGSSLSDLNRSAGSYAGRLLKGERPADLPVQQATKIELTVNLKTAKALGVTVPLTLLGRADEVIE